MITRLLEDYVLPLPPQVFVGFIAAFVVVHVFLGTIPILIYFERKGSAYIQDRVGPNRTGFDFGLPPLKKLFRGFGFWGLGQSIADGLKFLLKEDYQPRGADGWLFTLAPCAAVIPALIGWAVIPWGGVITIPDISLFGMTVVDGGRAVLAAVDINIGFIYLLAVAGVGVYGVTLGGWASNNKYSFLGGLRASASMISYEIPMGLCILAVVLIAGTVSPIGLVESQIAHGWFIVYMPLAAILFYVCTLAEANRAPFDNAECEQELVGGFHTEYSSMRFALFFLAEYAHMITGAAFFVLLFLGGYHLPGVALTSPENTGLLAGLVKFFVFFNKVILMILFAMLIRWTIPRLRYDQVMKLCWNSFIPTTITLVVATSVALFLGQDSLPALLLVNVLVAAAGMVVFPWLRQSSDADVNRRIPLAGSRYSPLPGAAVTTQPTNPLARADGPSGETVAAY
jgi:NADH-quinone oxidoreductase subunit H